MLGRLCFTSFYQLWRAGTTRVQCEGFSLPWVLLLRNPGSRPSGFRSSAHELNGCGSWALEHRRNSCAWIRCSTACGILPNQVANSCLLHWQADYIPPSHQGSPGSPEFFLYQRLELFYEPSGNTQVTSFNRSWTMDGRNYVVDDSLRLKCVCVCVVLFL